MTVTEKNQAANDRQFHRVSLKNEAVRLMKLGWSVADIADKMGIAESSVRGLLSTVKGFK